MIPNNAKYRIEQVGDKFYPQFRMLWFFWVHYHTRGSDAYVVKDSKEEAIKYIQADIKNELDLKNRKIVWGE